VIAKMRNIGEACTAANRFHVAGRVADEFAEKLAARLGEMKVGRGTEDGIDVGPLVARDRRERVRELLDNLITRAHDEGSLRRDFTSADLTVLGWSLGRVIEATADVAPRAVYRHLHFALDGMRPRAATRQVEGPLDREQLVRALRSLHARRFGRRSPS
jgi:hypothetical protein